MSDEFDEFDVTEDEFDAMVASGRPVELVGQPGWLLAPSPDLYSLVTSSPATYSLSESLILTADYPPSVARTNVVTQRELAAT